MVRKTQTLREIFDQVSMVAELVPAEEAQYNVVDLGPMKQGSQPVTNVAFSGNVVPLSEPERVFQELLADHGGKAGAELAIVTAALKALATIHQTNHWQAMGDSFYGDHQLFTKLYDDVVSEVDSMGERAVGIGGVSLVDTMLLTKHQFKLQSVMGCKSNSMMSDLAALSLGAETKFLALVDVAVKCMQQHVGLSKGTDNLIAGILDVHESHVYLLKQRVGG